MPVLPAAQSGQVEVVRSERPQQRRQAGAAQRHEGLARLPTEPLQGLGRIVADAVDGKKRGVGAADETGQHVLSFFDSAVMVNELARHLLDERPQLSDLMRPSADVENRNAGKVEIL